MCASRHGEGVIYSAATSNALPSISVIVPTCNSLAYIDQCLDSICSQTRSAMEIIAVDDASVDETAAHVRSLHPDVNIFEGYKAKGQGHSRNVGVEMARGDYIALCDHDDIWAPDHLEKVAGLLDRFPDVPLAFSRVRLIGEASGCWPADGGCIPEAPAYVFVQLLRNNIIIPTGTIFRRELWREVGPFDESLPLGADDYRFYLETALRHPIVGRREPTAFWRIHDKQESRNRGRQVVKAFRHRLDMLGRHVDQLRGKGLFSNALAATTRSWEEHVEEAWATRNLPYLRRMVRFGLERSPLRRATLPYVWKAVLPEFAVRMLVEGRVIRPAKRSIIKARE